MRWQAISAEPHPCGVRLQRRLAAADEGGAYVRLVVAAHRLADQPPGTRVIDDNRSRQDRSMTCIQGECAYGRAEEEGGIQRGSSARARSQ